VGAGLLLAPASGEETRNSIGEKVQDISDKVKERMSNQKYGATGTE
jgi:gas vesicle protein